MKRRHGTGNITGLPFSCGIYKQEAGPPGCGLESVKTGREAHRTFALARPVATVNDNSVLLSERAPNNNKRVNCLKVIKIQSGAPDKSGTKTVAY
jgi:hypothetical protein